MQHPLQNPLHLVWSAKQASNYTNNHSFPKTHFAVRELPQILPISLHVIDSSCLVKWPIVYNALSMMQSYAWGSVCRENIIVCSVLVAA